MVVDGGWRELTKGVLKRSDDLLKKIYKCFVKLSGSFQLEEKLCTR